MTASPTEHELCTAADTIIEEIQNFLEQFNDDLVSFECLVDKYDEALGFEPDEEEAVEALPEAEV